jgi:hypothetical protein
MIFVRVGKCFSWPFLVDPIGHGEHFTVSGVGERKADGGRSPLFVLAVPRDPFPFEAGSLEVLLLLGTFIDSNRLVPHEPFNILVDERVQGPSVRLPQSRP